MPAGSSAKLYCKIKREITKDKRLKPCRLSAIFVLFPLGKNESLYPSRDLSIKNRFLDSGFIVYMAAILARLPAGTLSFCDFNVYSTNGPVILVFQSIM